MNQNETNVFLPIIIHSYISQMLPNAVNVYHFTQTNNFIISMVPMILTQ